MTRACASCLTPSRRIYCSDACRHADETWIRLRAAAEAERKAAS